ncbi:MAG: SIR2 family protein [Verrucomicrobiota bacterium]
MSSDEQKMFFYQGGENIAGEDSLKSIKQKIAELSNIKNVSFFLGAGASSYAIPSMKDMQKKIAESIDASLDDEIKDLYEKIDSDNLEEKLTILYAKQHFLQGITGADDRETSNVEDLIEHIEDSMYSEINIDLTSGEAEKNLNLYKLFYQKTALRNKDLSRINVFTTNNDLLNEKALDSININFNNGFGGGLERVFNPARFHYTFSKKIDANLEKFEPLENMVYLYKLHGSISWIEQEGNSLFNIHEVSVNGGDPKGEESHVLIFPTPLKQAHSLGTPYADLIREFQTKLSQPNSVVFIIGYSFSDEHLNNIIYQALASNTSISVVIFGEYNECPLAKIQDSRIYRIFGTDEEDKKIHYFEYIVEELLPNADENIDTTLLDTFISSIKYLKGDSIS